MQPLQRAISCLGSAKISASAGGKHAPEVTHAWTLNAGSGMVVRSVEGGELGLFKASMHYEIVLSDDRHEGKWRVSTRAYAYELVGAALGYPIWAMHWHPVGRSGITFPHFHLPAYGEHHHLKSARHTLEAAVQWCIEMGGEATAESAQVLAETEGVHKLWRSWSDDGPSVNR